jgi:hypothetical protein
MSYSETLVTIYQPIWRCIQEGLNFRVFIYKPLYLLLGKIGGGLTMKVIYLNYTMEAT